MTNLQTNRTTTLIFLTAVYALSTLDRYLLGVLIPSIKEDLGLSDTALGLLAGAAFAIFYATLGLPLARLADKYGRKLIIIISLFIFSIMTSLCGLAVGFWTLFLARVGVGIGEAGTTPASLSMLSDLYPKEQRSTAMSVLSIGGNIGVLAGFILGGLIAEHYGWQYAFIFVGIPGVILAAILALKLQEPTRGQADNLGSNESFQQTSIKELISFLWGQKSFLCNIFGMALILFFMNGMLAWLPSYFSRSHGMELSNISLMVGLALGLGGPIGTILIGGILADKLTAKNISYGAKMVAIGAFLLVPTYLIVISATNLTLAIGAFVLPAIMGMFFQGPLLAMSQAATPVSMRSSSAALMLFVGNIIGLGLGPFVIGFISESLSDTYGTESLRYALYVIPVAALLAAIVVFAGSFSLKKDIDRAENWSR
ncbi:MFS transporter [uncultured Paraglaciecola sp.]|uniref:spinster family MFS transporter n=1 Tax=uncultured Paraglaciecola sp. TaxID=1765024 RepID=UPI002592BCDF|nr:MFS transporter [uncultured Paraglaciecola sp.]